MTETKITFQNKIDMRVQAQIYAESELVSTCVTAPGESCTLAGRPGRYDIYCKNGTTGSRLAYKLDIEAKTLSLSLHRGTYIIA